MGDINFLIVEDSPTMRQLISFSLKRIRNSRVVEATDGVDALKKLSEGKFNLIIADINMPLMDGLKLLSLVRKDPNYKQTPVIIVTTEGAEVDREKGLKLGANAYLSKPIQTNELLKTVKELLQIQAE
ncbi:MAG TPA: response regulator [Nitrospiria bacterium]|jgi:two-component system chemotaxis response regulator CheY